MNKLHELRQNKKDAVLRAEAAEARAKAKGATAEEIAAANAECDQALSEAETLEAEIKAEQKRVDDEAAAAAARKAKLASLRQGTGPRTVERSHTPSPTPRVEHARDLSEDDPRAGFRSHREFFHAVMTAGLTGRADDRLAPLRAAAGSDEQGEYSNGFGGFLVPEGFRPGMLTVGIESDPTAGRTTLVPMDTPTVKINARTDKNHTTSVTGGLRFYRRAETTEGTASRMEMEQVVLHANPLMGVNFQTEELLADSPSSIAAIIEAGFREELPAYLLNEKLRGTGVGQMLGVLNSGNPALVSVAKEGSQAADTIVGANILKMRARCWGYGRAIWLANIDTYEQLAKVHVAGTNGDVFLFSPARGEDVPDMLLGRPIFFTEFVETLGDKGDILLADWSQYLEGQLGGVNSAESMHVRFLNNERCFKVSLRNDGRPWWRSAITPVKGANSLSPFVTLDARA